MRLGFVGLGRMGSKMAARLLEEGHELVCYDPAPPALEAAAALGATAASDLSEVARLLDPPRVVWVMVPAGEATSQVVSGLSSEMSPGDVIVDGGNSFYKDSMARAMELGKREVRFLDCGTSGGLEGAAHGASLTIGGDPAGVEVARPIFESLACPDGWARVGPSGAGHFVKMVHNGIEYALEEAYGEGFELLEAGPYDLDLAEVARVWDNGSVIRSWLLELAGDSFLEDPKLAKIEGRVGGGETGAWALAAAVELAVPAPSIALALMERYRSRESQSFAAKVVASVRHRFGGHPVAPSKEAQK